MAMFPGMPTPLPGSHRLLCAADNVRAKRQRLTDLCAALCTEMSDANLPTFADGASPVQLRGEYFRYYTYRIQNCIFKVKHTSDLVNAMSTYQLCLPQRTYVNSNVNISMGDLSWLNERLLAIPRWSDATHGDYDENWALVTLMLGLFRRRAKNGLVLISVLDFYDTFTQMCPATMIDEHTSGTDVLREAGRAA